MLKQKIRPGVWRLSFEWEANPQAKTNEIYVINGIKKTLVVDTSKPEVVSFEKLLEAIRSTGADLTNTEVVLTHHHLDHCGNANDFIAAGIPVFALEEESYLPKSAQGSPYFLDLAGVPEPERDQFLNTYIEMSFCRDLKNNSISRIKNGFVFDIEPFRFSVIETPGHSSDSCCLYSSKNELLFAGDTIAGGFVPPINTTKLNMHKIKYYTASLHMLLTLNVSLCLPGHGSPIIGQTHYNERLEIIQKTYCRRSKKALALLKSANAATDAYTLSTLYLNERREPRTNVSKYYHAVHISMMLSYLEYLYDRGLALREVLDGHAFYLAK